MQAETGLTEAVVPREQGVVMQVMQAETGLTEAVVLREQGVVMQVVFRMVVVAKVVIRVVRVGTVWRNTI